MGMESFNQVPEVPAEPEESERIDDVEKARAMAHSAHSGSSYRERAVESRRWAKTSPEEGSEEANLTFTRQHKEKQAISLDKAADEVENHEGVIYDIKKANPDMTDLEALLAANKARFEESVKKKESLEY